MEKEASSRTRQQDPDAPPHKLPKGNEIAERSVNKTDDPKSRSGKRRDKRSLGTAGLHIGPYPHGNQVKTLQAQGTQHKDNKERHQGGSNSLLGN